MGIDMSKMKEKLASLNRKGSEKNNFWRPKDGEQTIRIVPTADGDPFKEFWFHYNLGSNTPFLSPKKNFGDECPLDDFVRTLYKQGDPDSVKMAKNLTARQRFFAPVLVRGEEEQGVRIWGFGKTAYQELLNLVLNPDYGDITDVDSGTDLVIAYGKPAGAQFPQTSITPRRRTSPLVEDSDESARLLDAIPDVTTLFERPSPEDVGKMLHDYMTSIDEEMSASTGISTISTAPTSKDNSVDSAFNELVNS